MITRSKDKGLLKLPKSDSLMDKSINVRAMKLYNILKENNIWPNNLDRCSKPQIFKGVS